MPTDVDFKRTIENNLNEFQSKSLKESSLQLLDTLGYSSDKTITLEPNTAEGFKTFLKKNHIANLNEDKAHLEEWQSVDFLFQLTDSEIASNQSLFDPSSVDVSDKRIESYLFFAIGLKNQEYRRSVLAEITREVNRVFPMPALILFKHGETLTFSIIDRRLNKKDATRDVLLKVTLIKDIRLANPHRAHIEILSDLAITALDVRNFVELHHAWQKVLDTKELNKKFFQELANWYFWAVGSVQFPRDVEKNSEIRNSTNVIRLITRLIFVWFLKEKGLVSDKLFDKRYLDSILKFEDENESTFYKAILQNLFFATLNSEMGKRKFIAENNGGRNSQHFVHNVFRYKSEFKKPDEAIKEIFEPIPFLNGGLFECLDKEIEVDGKTVRVRVDGFSNHKENFLYVPDELFFVNEKTVDLSEIYDDTKKSSVKVRGLINILHSYKFTVTENTPIEEEIALDPELLGRVFENLLASYNPETKTTARKQTGSFYTPREIVNYMVDESLMSYLGQKLLEETEGFGFIALGDTQATMFGNEGRTQQKLELPLTINRWRDKGEELDAALRDLFSYTEDSHEFNETEVEILIKAIDHCKILDPACGSGAFPMGILHRLVHLLSKLDTDNIKWKQWQKQKALKETERAYEIGEVKTRDERLTEINHIFEDNSDDYGRKLFLIENCIYGVDIQPIAIQISKLRFFISLIVDQSFNDDPLNNRTVRPLPNLETKFVAANTLLGLEAQGGLKPEKVDALEKQLKDVRAKHFSARSRKTKEKYRDRDREIRLEIADLLRNGGIRGDIADQIASWNPYDQNTSASWFDQEWMLGIVNGFDIIIGNPPYLESRHPGFSDTLKDQLQAAVQLRWGDDSRFITRGADLLVYFFESALRMVLQKDGQIVFLTQNSWLSTEYGQKLQKFLLRKTNVQSIVDSDFKYFDADGGPNINTVISAFKGRNTDPNNNITFARFHEDFTNLNLAVSGKRILSEAKSSVEAKRYSYSNLLVKEIKWGILLAAQEDIFFHLLERLKQRAKRLGEFQPLLSYGQGLNVAKSYYVTREQIEDIRLPESSLIPILTSDDGAPFCIERTRHFLINKAKVERSLHAEIKKAGISLFDSQTTRKKPPVLIMPRGVSRHFCAYNPNAAFSGSGVDVYDLGGNASEEIKLNLWLSLNSSICWMWREISGRKNLGGGMLKAEAVDMEPLPIYMDFGRKKDIKRILDSLQKRDSLDITQEVRTPEHCEIDSIVASHLGLTTSESEEIVGLLVAKVNERTRKAGRSRGSA